jgi:mRNA-degrading endonuclease RelE of RelBE toxin-antitoxin system
MFTIEYVEDVAEDLARLTAYRRKAILDAIEKRLQHEPHVETRHRKRLPALVPPWEHVPPVWELRIGEYRVFYDIQEAEETVKIRAVRHKPPHKTTEEIL